jgi:hypothetical protein
VVNDALALPTAAELPGAELAAGPRRFLLLLLLLLLLGCRALPPVGIAITASLDWYVPNRLKTPIMSRQQLCDM